MTIDLRRTLLAGTFAFAAVTAPAIAADSDVVAKVGDQEITELDLKAAAANIGEDYAKLPPELQKAAILSAAIDITVLANEAEKVNLQDEPDVASALAFQRDRGLHNAYFAKNGVAELTDAEVKARYDEAVAAMPEKEEFHARHILVKTKEEAEAVIKELDGGKAFADVAAEKSTGPSASSGGDLGFFSKGQMVPAFEEAAFALEPGKYTEEPVETQFGWHVIKLEEKRAAEKPKLDQIEPQLRQSLLREKYIAMVQKARDEQTIEYTDPAMKTQIEDLEKGMKASAAGDPAAEPAAK